MSKERDFNFSKARRFTEKERELIRFAIEKKLGVKVPRLGRPAKGAEKYRPTSIRLHPKVVEWAKAQAKKRGTGYQTVINEILLRHAA